MSVLAWVGAWAVASVVLFVFVVALCRTAGDADRRAQAFDWADDIEWVDWPDFVGLRDVKLVDAKPRSTSDGSTT